MKKILITLISLCAVSFAFAGGEACKNKDAKCDANCTKECCKKDAKKEDATKTASTDAKKDEKAQSADKK
ncbi:MAG: hypothetical protein JSR48_03745 [Verrucomicrobia bacterium]|nr:hypothetical protein [Verrucomicrobiota bacterium]